MLQVGFHYDEYVHGAIIHVDIIEDKIWIQYDGTRCIATDLVENGVLPETIVLGFRPPEVCPYTGFAVA
jgi:hypothetical protein